MDPMKMTWEKTFEIFAAKVQAAQSPTSELEAYMTKGNAQRAADQLRNPQLCAEKLKIYEVELILRKLREEERNGPPNE